MGDAGEVGGRTGDSLTVPKTGGTRFYSHVRLMTVEDVTSCGKHFCDRAKCHGWKKPPVAVRRKRLAASRSKTKSRHGEDDAYDAYPWSQYFRHEVMVQSKIPKPPYFRQLPPGLRPDTLILPGIPALWFLDDEEEHLRELEEERKEREKTKPKGVALLEEDKVEETNTLFWFSQNGHLIMQAACSRFGPVKRVNLMFEMESRDMESTLMFDAQIQFETYKGFRDAFLALDGGLFFDDRHGVPCFLEASFDTTGFFSKRNIRLRHVRQELEKRQERQAAHRKKKEKYLRDRKVKDAVDLLKKELGKTMTELSVIEEMYESVSDLPFDLEVRDWHTKASEALSSCETSLVSVLQALREKRAGQLGLGATDPATGVQDAQRKLNEAKRTLKNTEREIFRLQSVRTTQLPNIDDVLRKGENTTFMLGLVLEKQRVDPEFFAGVTLFVPRDLCFGDGNDWSEECWGTHIISGPYEMRDLYDLSNKGTGQLLCMDMQYSLSVSLDALGFFTVWIEKRGHPRRVIHVTRPDVKCAGGAICHFVDRIIYPPAY